jgi:hypothetical protein
MLSLFIVVVKVALFVNARMFIGIACVLYVKHPSTKQSLAHAERLKKIISEAVICPRPHSEIVNKSVLPKVAHH